MRIARFICVLLVCVGGIGEMNPATGQNPAHEQASSGWQQGRGWGWVWGEDDQVVSLNAMTANSIVAALRQVQQG